jgi:DNA-binding NtrC family response regulator
MIFSLNDCTNNTKRTRRNRGSILIVEDNVQLATCLEMLLEAHSYEVCRTTDVPGGLEHIKLLDFDAILCDFVMPGLTGDFLYEAVGRLKAHLCERFIFMSGHSEDPKWAEFAASTNRPIFWKPFAVGDLLHTIECLVQSKKRNQDKAVSRYTSLDAGSPMQAPSVLAAMS